ncbi:DUF1707 domain-containing protein [Nocardiopsis composta]|uniref:DUF1707 domain-containing protein n=1 Tax=Nocardiopsis composta TaxID=157465 RepID=A0A7W8QP70_9ACTN|nr:DUF1707 domain-containing protein [Nocardiopsis composta]MBB5433041.1 hypothetical protein [Nocardiopsis composta]
MADDSLDLRAGDAERDRVAKLLQENFAQGRLDSGEFSSRLESAYRARTRRELEAVTRDLPDGEAAVPEPAAVRVDLSGLPPERGVLRDPALLIPWGLWAGVNTLCFVIWLILFLTGEVSYPWFLWVLFPWGIVMLFITITLALLQRGGAEDDAEKG